jgi:pilus assembly protein CpaD
MRRLLLAAPILLSACDTYWVGDYRERFPVTVQRETPLLLVAFAPNRAELPSEERARLDVFLAGYLAQNSGPLKVAARRAGPSDRLAIERLVAIEARAVALGIPKSLVETGLANGRGEVGDVTVTYERYTAQVPECGDWSKNTAVDWTNTPSANFGCATQRYVGLQVADPRDLIAARGQGVRDAAHMSDQLAKYRTGAPTIAQQHDWTNWRQFFTVSGNNDK